MQKYKAIDRVIDYLLIIAGADEGMDFNSCTRKILEKISNNEQFNGNIEQASWKEILKQEGDIMSAQIKIAKAFCNKYGRDMHMIIGFTDNHKLMFGDKTCAEYAYRDLLKINSGIALIQGIRSYVVLLT